MQRFRLDRRKPTRKEIMSGLLSVLGLVIVAFVVTRSKTIDWLGGILARSLVDNVSGTEIVRHPGQYFEFKKGFWVWIPGGAQLHSERAAAESRHRYLEIIDYSSAGTKMISISEIPENREVEPKRGNRVQVAGYDGVLLSVEECELLTVFIPVLRIMILCSGYSEDEIRDWLGRVRSYNPGSRQ